MSRYLTIATLLALSACARGAAYNAGYAAEGYIGATSPVSIESIACTPISGPPCWLYGAPRSTLPSFDLTNALLQQRLLTMPYPTPVNLFAR